MLKAEMTGTIRSLPSLRRLYTALLLAALVVIAFGGASPAHAQVTDYDTDDDGLIEVSSLAQLDAIRFDLDGDGSAGDAGYAAAFPNAANGMGCPSTGCVGYELAADLDFDTNGSGDADDGDDYWNDGKGWWGIGKREYRTGDRGYAAVFEGNGHTIRNLYFVSRGLAYPKIGERRGLFDVLTETGAISNVTLENVRVDGNGYTVGGLVGDNYGAISNAGVTGSVSGWYVTGGLVGYNYGTITDSYASGTVFGGHGRTGGLIGGNRGGRVVRSYSTADVSVGTATAYEGWPREHLDMQPYDFGGLIGYSRNYDGSNVSILASYATGRVSGDLERAGGLVGYNGGGEIFASYATGDVSVSGGYVGALAGINTGPISASYALGAVSSQRGYRVGGLIGLQYQDPKNGHRCDGCSIPNVRPGHAGRSGVTASYWNGQYGLTTAELRDPTGYTDIYLHWDNLRDNSGDSYAWDFGTSQDFPVLRDAGPSVAAQRAGIPDPAEYTEWPVNRRPGSGGIDYDQDDDRLIEVRNLDQLDAIRYDMTGSGSGSWYGYKWGYPNPLPGMGCPRGGCIGYELVTDLDFDTNGNGKADPGDHYWNGIHLPDSSEECRSWYGGGPTQGVKCDDYFGNDGEGWRPLGVQGADDLWRGVFEGNGHTIRNLYINTLDTPFTEEVLNRRDIYGLPTTAGDGYHDNKGIFWDIGYTGVVRNLRLENVNVSGKNSVGALAGENEGIISNVLVTGAVSGISSVGGLVGITQPSSYITGSSSDAGVSGRKTGGKDVGGLVGVNQGVIQASYARGAVSGWADNTGGLVGGNASGTIKASYATGPVSSAGQRAGGLAGGNGGSIVASYSTGAATASGGEAGGLLGRLRTGAVTAAYWDTQSSGRATSHGGSGKTTAELQQPTGYTGIYADWNLDLDLDGSGDAPWEFGTASQYPVLKYGDLSPTDQRAPFTAQALDLPHVGGNAPPAPNRAPTVSGSLDDVTVSGKGGTKDVSLTGLFDDPDSDALTITAHTLTITAEPPPGHDGSSYIEVVTAAVSADYSGLTLTGHAPGTATVTVTANDGKGGVASADFVATVEAGESETEETQEQETAGDYTALIAKMHEWRNDPQWVSYKDHTDRWDRALLAFGETVADTTLTPMTAAEAQAFADRGDAWSRWVSVAAALREIESAGQQQPNQAPTVTSAIGDATILNESGTHQASLSGVFSDADNDPITITAASSDETKATVSVASDGSSLTVSAQARGTATVTVAAADGSGGKVDDAFTVTVKAAPVVASNIGDVSGLEAGATREVSLSGVFSDADGDSLTITAASSDETKATVSMAADYSTLTVAGVSEGTATVTVAAQDSDGNRVSDTFDVEVAKKYAALIAKMYQWRNDPQWSSFEEHTDRWDRALLAFGEPVAETTLTPMTADEAQAFADKGSAWSRWVEVAAALREIEAAGRQQAVPNRAPTVSASIADVTIVNEGGTHQASLSSVFSDADNDALAITAASSDETKATVSVASDGSSLTVSAQARGTATITVTADDGSGGAVDDAFTVTVKAAPVVASALADRTGLEVGSTQDISLFGVFSDADGDSLIVTAASNDVAIATVSVAADGSKLTLTGVAEGTATITVTAQDSDGNRVMDDFDVLVAAPQQPLESPNQAPTVSSGIADVTIVNERGTQEVSLSGVFDDGDGDSLTVSASSSDRAVATVSVPSDGSSLTVSAQSRGTATITVTANDGNGGKVDDAFTVTVKAAPVVASTLNDLTGLEVAATRDISLSGVFADADNDALTVTAASDDAAVVTVTVSSDYSTLTLEGVSEGTTTVTVSVQDSDGNRVSDAFGVSVSKVQEQDPAPTPTPTPEPEPETSDIVARYDANGDGSIDESEWLQAKSDFIAGKITYSEMVEVYKAYLGSN